MNIIKPGTRTIVPPKLFFGRCPACGCEFTCTNLESFRGPKDDGTRFIYCPNPDCIDAVEEKSSKIPLKPHSLKVL